MNARKAFCGPQPHQIIECGRYPDRPAGIRPKANRTKTCCNCSTCTATGAARHPARIVRISCASENRAYRCDAVSKLVQIGFCQHDCSGVNEPLNLARRRIRHKVRERDRPSGRGHTGHVVIVFHQYRHAMKRTASSAGLPLCVKRPGNPDCIRVNPDH